MSVHYYMVNITAELIYRRILIISYQPLLLIAINYDLHTIVSFLPSLTNYFILIDILLTGSFFTAEAHYLCTFIYLINSYTFSHMLKLMHLSLFIKILQFNHLEIIL